MIAIFQKMFTLYKPLGWINSIALLGCAILIRVLFFGCYIQHEERYRQPDTLDYHIAAFSLSNNRGMFHIATGEPIFWRTPGYPLYLAFFYNWYNVTSPEFDAGKNAQKIALYIQILLCSFIPLIFWFLARSITNCTPIAWVCSWYAVLHPGLILSSCFLLSDALALIPFLLALLLLFQALPWWHTRTSDKFHQSSWNVVISALLLGIYTWIRPNGQFTVFLLLIVIACSAIAWRQKLQKLTLFILVFGATIAPWYIRNYTLTNHWFFCPMSGPYLQTFSAPKIIRRLTQQPLIQCINFLAQPAHAQWLSERESARKECPPRFVSRELVCAQYAWPVITKHPFWFMVDWMQEVCKTTLDLYAHQLVAFTNNTFSFDPVEEFLSIKLAECLYALPVPWWIRIICWVEMLSMLMIWLGIFGGIIYFMIPLLSRKKLGSYQRAAAVHLIISGFIFAGTVCMTGGFGYARLRLPGEFFLILTAITFWHWAVTFYRTTYKSAQQHNAKKLAINI